MMVPAKASVVGGENLNNSLEMLGSYSSDFGPTKKKKKHHKKKHKKIRGAKHHAAGSASKSRSRGKGFTSCRKAYKQVGKGRRTVR